MVLSMDRWIGKVAVITGASSGIGAATAEQLVEIGVNVVGLDRRFDRLEPLAKKLDGKKGKLYPIKTDVSKEEDVLNAFKWIKENLSPVHILINCAGIGGSTGLLYGDSETWKNIFAVNVIGLSMVNREAIKNMRENNVDGHIINTCSIGGHQIISAHFQNVYPSSKFAVRALSETLRLELNSLKSKIKITNLSPGAVNTEMIDEVFRKTELFKVMEEGHEILEPEQIADGIMYALSTPPHVQIQQLTIRSVRESF